MWIFLLFPRDATREYFFSSWINIQFRVFWAEKNQKCGVFCKNIGQILLRITRPSILTIWIWPLSLDGMGSLNHVPTRALLRMICADKVKEKGCLSICYIYIAKNDKTWTRPRRIGCQVQAAARAWAPLSGRGSRCWGLGCRSLR